MRSFSARDVSRTFRLGGKAIGVLRSIHWDFAVGQLTTIVGASGAGKTTLLHTLGGLDRPERGTIVVDDQSVYALSRGQLAAFRNRRVGFVFQAYHLMPELSALENVMLPGLIGRHSVRDRAERLLDHVGLADRRHHRPAELSGGEQQRVCIARALVNEPELLFADEPTGNLDRQSGRAVLDLMLDLQKSRRLTAVLVTHDPTIAESGQCRLSLIDGTLVPTP